MSETSTENQSERLIVKNFGPLKDVDIELKNIMVFIGPQASGKSTLAKILYMINSLLSIRMNMFYNINVQENFVRENLKKFNINFFHENTEIYYKQDGMGAFNIKDKEIVFEFSPEGQELFKKAKEAILMLQDALHNINIENFIKITNKGENSNQPLKIGQASIINEIIFENFAKKGIYIPAERNIFSSISDFFVKISAAGISIPKFILDFGGKLEDAKNELKKIYIDFLDIAYEHNSGIGDRIFISSNDKPISLSEAASGVQSVIPLYLVVKHFAENDLLVIEEPELNLFPETQKKLVEFIIETCRDKTKRLIITTHSPYILTVLNNLIQAHNVVKERPELEEEVNKIIPKERWLDFDKVGVYYVAEGTATNIMHEKNRIIKAENIDSVSKNLSNEFGQLLDLQYGD